MPFSKLLLIALFLRSFSPSIQAQNTPQTILENPNITWVAEAYTNYIPTASSSELGKEQMSALYQIEEWNVGRRLKLLEVLNENQLYNPPIELANLVFNLDATKGGIYETADLNKKYTLQAYEMAKTRVDTIVTVDPQAYDEAVPILVTNQWKADDIKVFKVKQLLYYNATTKQLGALPLAIAPMVFTVNEQREMVYQPLFWLRVQDIQERLDLTASIYTYAIRMTRNIREEEMKVVKGIGSLADIVMDMIAHGKQHPQQAKFYHIKGAMQPMTEEDIRNLDKQLDTISVFSPDVFGELIQVVSGDFRAKQVQSIRLVQDWVWNSSKQQLCIRLIAYAPIRHPYGVEENESCYLPYFYKKPNQ